MTTEIECENEQVSERKALSLSSVIDKERGIQIWVGDGQFR